MGVSLSFFFLALQIEAVYLFVVGDCKVDTVRLLRTRRMKNAQPIHCVSFNARREETIKRLKELSHRTAGRYEGNILVGPNYR